VDLTRKPQLLEEIVDYLGKHGVAGLTMRGLASGIGVSTTVLTYHFGGKEKLLEESVVMAEEGMLGAMEEGIADGGVPAGLRRFWSWLVSDRSRIARLGVVIEIMALDNGAWAPLLTEGPSAISIWIETMERSLVEDGLAKEEAAQYATLLHSGLLGLCLDLWDSEEIDRISPAAELLAQFAETVVSRSGAARTT
jgi:AcrR family transcriptional regulator